MQNRELSKAIETLLPALELILPQDGLAMMAVAAQDELWEIHLRLRVFLHKTLLLLDCKLYSIFVQAGIHHKDDMACLLVEKLWERLKSAYH